MENIFETIKEIAEAKEEQKKAINQIDAYETEQKIKKYIDKLVAQYAALEEPIDEEKLHRLATERYPKGIGVFTPEGAELLQKAYKHGYKDAKEEIK